MTPRKKAIELFNLINDEVPINASFKDSAEEAKEKIIKDVLITKSIALITINEIENVIRQSCMDGGNTLKYWEKVKIELDKL